VKQESVHKDVIELRKSSYETFYTVHV